MPHNEKEVELKPEKGHMQYCDNVSAFVDFNPLKKVRWPKEKSSGKFTSGKLIETDYEQGWNHCLEECKDAYESSQSKQELSQGGN